MELKNKTALVTGGAVRIGRALVEALAAEGVNVVIHYHHSQTPAQDLARRLKTSGVQAWTVRATLNSEKQCRQLIASAFRKAGQVDFLINNAAVFHKDRLRNLTEAKLLTEFWPNLFAPLLLMSAFAEKAGQGKVINLLDRRITGDDLSCAPYVLSKKGLASATRLAALEFAPNFTVNAVAPGAILPPPKKDAKRVRDLAGAAPLQRMCTPGEIAQAALYLLRSDGVTGQTLFVDAGQHLLN